MSKSNYLENALLDHILGGFGGGAFVRPATVYVALFIAAPTDAGGGTEVAGGSYGRAAVPNDATRFPAAAGGVKSNGVEIFFAQATAPWGNVTHWGLFDALSGGNLLYWGALTASRTVQTGDAPSVAVGQLQITED